MLFKVIIYHEKNSVAGFISSHKLFGKFCYGDLRNSAIVNYNGDIYKCTAVDFAKEQRDGYLSEKAKIDRSASAIDLLSNLQGSMPGLKVNTALQSYTIEGQQPVMMINGKRVSSDRIKSLNNNNILRIEYQNTPDIRYSSEASAGVINFIVKPDLQGGSVFLNINAPLNSTTINTNFRATWNYKKSEWSIGNYFATSNMYKSHYDISEQYISPNKTITQTGEGNNGNYNGWSNPVNLGYTYMYDPNIPSFTQQTSIARFNNSLSGTIGNMSVDPSVWMRNRVYVRYKHKRFVSTLWASYSRTNKPIYRQYYYIDDKNSPYYDKFVGITSNGTHTSQINVQCDVGLNELWDFCSLYATFGWDNYYYPNFGLEDKFNHFYASINGNVWWKRWSFNFNLCLSPRWIQDVNTLNRSARDNSFIAVTLVSR
ncbi:MAG: hypothetical protein PHR45_01790 [Muribaculaceae bacterium]|nr:hypothetical protein [Muribaculaceae bacterium]